MRPVLAAALLFAALPLSAQILQTIDVDPPQPDSSMPVQVHLAGVNSDGCVPANANVTTSGKSITIDVAPRPGACVLVATPWGERIDIGRLAPGDYSLTVTSGKTTLGTASFTVTDAQQPFEVYPSVVSTSGGTPVRMEINGGALLCAPGAVACQNVESLTIGGKAATFQIVDGRTLVAIAPPHAAGPAPIELKVELLPLMEFTAFRYFDPNAAPDPVAFDHVLFPVVFSGPGAFGSMWETEGAIENRTPGQVGEWRTETFGPVPPRGTDYLTPATRDRGLLYFPERRLGSSLRYGLHVRDLSRSSQDVGTQIPVVFPRQTTFDLSLLDVPADARYRRMLRIYDVDGVERSVTVTVVSMGPLSTPGETFTVLLTNGCTSSVCNAPAYAAINLDPVVARVVSGGFVRVRVSSPLHDARLWAVVTATNNETQHVTAYMPQ
jgi:hypothetical protein